MRAVEPRPGDGRPASALTLEEVASCYVIAISLGPLRHCEEEQVTPTAFPEVYSASPGEARRIGALSIAALVLVCAMLVAPVIIVAKVRLGSNILQARSLAPTPGAELPPRRGIFGAPTLQPTASNTPIHTPTLEPTTEPAPSNTPTASIRGVVDLQRSGAAKGSPSWVTALKVIVYSNGTAVGGKVTTTDAQGQFSIPLTVPFGVYDVGAKSYHSLENIRTGMNLVQGATLIDFATLAEGDANDNNAVEILDYSMLYSVFDTADARADFNQNGTVEVLDYSYFYANYDQSGPRLLGARKDLGDLLGKLAYTNQGLALIADVGLSVDSATTQNGDIFTLDIRVQPNGQEVDTADVRLTFDRNYLRVVDSSGNASASIIADPDGVFGNVLRNNADNSAGAIRYAAGPDFTQSPRATSFRLATIRFQAIQPTSGTLIQLGGCTVARSGIPSGLTKTDGQVAIQRRIPLALGLSLFSFNVQPMDVSYTRPLTRPNEVLSSLEGNYSLVVGYLGGGAKGYYPTLPPEYSDLRELDYKHGYYIYMTATDTLELWGGTVAATSPIPLASGPNLVGYLPDMDINVASALSGISGRYKSVLGLERAVHKWYVPWYPYTIYSTLKCLRRNGGYWITTNQPTTLSYPTTGGCSVPQGASDLGEGAAAQVPSPPSWCDLYSLDSPGVAAGAVVRSYDPDGVLCGEAVAFADGQWGVMHATGDHPDTPEDEGAEEGDLLTFTVDGQQVESESPVIWESHGFKEVRLLSAMATHTPTSSPTSSAQPSATQTPTSSLTASPTRTASPSLTPSVTPTATHTPTSSPTSSAQPSATQTPTSSLTASPTRTTSPSLTPSVAPTATHTPTSSPTSSAQPSPTHTPTSSLTASPTATSSPSFTPSVTPSLTLSWTGTPTATADYVLHLPLLMRGSVESQ